MTMAQPEIIEVRKLGTAEELLTSLAPATSDLWRLDGEPVRERGWIFRGQANGADGTIWDLTPSAHRPPDAFLPLRWARVEPVTGLDADEQRRQEVEFVMEFASIADHHGFVIPSDSHELRDPRQMPRDYGPNYHEFPPPNLVAIFALAQHHGIPTRLLDWTRKPLVAAYFAAEPVARRREPGKRANDEGAVFSVFALREAVAGACKDLDPEIHILSVPTATNAKLHAQGGCFSLVQPKHKDEHPLPNIKDVIERHAEQIREVWDLFPYLIEFQVPAREARTTLMMLKEMDVTAASINPGLDGVAQAQKEQCLYQWAPPESRS